MRVLEDEKTRSRYHVTVFQIAYHVVHAAFYKNVKSWNIRQKTPVLLKNDRSQKLKTSPNATFSFPVIALLM